MRWAAWLTSNNTSLLTWISMPNLTAVGHNGMSSVGLLTRLHNEKVQVLYLNETTTVT